MKPTMEKIPSANSTGAPYVAGNFGPLKSEVTAFDLEVIGHVPVDAPSPDRETDGDSERV